MNTLATKTRKCLTTHPQAGLPHQCAATRLDLRGGGAESRSAHAQDRDRHSFGGNRSLPSMHDLKTCGGLVHQSRGSVRPASPFNEKPPGNIRFVCTCALDAVGLVVGLLLVFGMLVVAGAIMRELGIYGGL